MKYSKIMLGAKTSQEVGAMLSKLIQCVVVAAAVSLLVVGCGRDNGMPGDLTAHLAVHGIKVRVTGSQAPLSSRAGIVFFDREPAIEDKIVTELRLEKIEPKDPRFANYASKISEKPVSLWGISGRPSILKLKSGAQFEYLYLLVTETRSYLLAEYAYG